MDVKKVSEFEFEVASGAGKVFASDELMEKIVGDDSLEQVEDVSKLPGIIGKSFAMPDIHRGYGFPIGGVAAFDMDEGVICPGGVGYDINCSVRLLKTNLVEADLVGKEKEIVKSLSKCVPSGVGSSNLVVGGRRGLSDSELDEVLKGGAQWAVAKGYGKERDWKFIEDEGKLDGRPEAVSMKAKGRGRSQLGTLGAGNHFLDVLVVDEVFDSKVSEVFGLEKGQVVIMIHCGSRGLGHQVATDYIRLMSNVKGSSLCDGKAQSTTGKAHSVEKLSCAGGLASDANKNLVGVSIKSELGKKYFGAMNAAANFAFANKQVITHYVRENLKHYFADLECDVVYDICHNIAKVESHFCESEVGSRKSEVEGEMREVLVMRKGATRAFGPGREEICEEYRDVGQPVLLPGSMGTSSYVLVGVGENPAWSSCAHGAGRAKSRTEAHKGLTFDEAKKNMEELGVFVEARGHKGMIEEAPGSYKDVDEVVRVCDGVGLGRKVARLRPKLVVIG